MTLFLAYDQNQFEIEDVTSAYEGMKYSIENGRLAIAWSDTRAMVVKNGEPVVTLSVKAKEEVLNASQIFTVLPGCEFADPGAVTIDDFTMKMADVVTVTGASELSMTNYPNPFNNTTKIVYTLPETGKVRLVLTNMFGKVVSVLVDGVQEAGTYTFEVNPSELNMTPGVYLYQIELDGNTDSYSKLSKMIYTR
jgi:archaellum component FlaG (FlaF/FlaG flagellin family)